MLSNMAQESSRKLAAESFSSRSSSGTSKVEEPSMSFKAPGTPGRKCEAEPAAMVAINEGDEVEVGGGGVQKRPPKKAKKTPLGELRREH